MKPDPRIGTTLAGYRIESLLGRGGMGVVYLAEHLRLGRRAALKLLAPELAEDEAFRERFVRESRIAASIEHPNIVPVYDAGEVDGLLYISMRYVEGSDLGALLRREGALDPERAVSIVEQVSRALDAAHARRLVHRDVKPGNILMTSRPDARDHCYLTDFGLTKRAVGASALTMTGQFVGTIDYVAPEQIEGKLPDARTDVYSLGCVLFECLTGAKPFERDSQVALIYAHLKDPPPSVTAKRPGLAAALDGVVATAMAKNREDRYPSCGALVSAARAALERSARAAPTAVAETEAAPPRATLPAERPPVIEPLAPPTEAARAPPGRRSRKVWIAASIAAAAVAGSALIVVRSTGPTVGDTAVQKACKGDRKNVEVAAVAHFARDDAEAASIPALVSAGFLRQEPSTADYTITYTPGTLTDGSFTVDGDVNGGSVTTDCSG